MKKLFVSILISMFFALGLSAQNTDSLYVARNLVDSTLLGKSVFNVLPSNVQVHQNASILKAFGQKLSSNSSKVQSGYRVRIFFDSKQTARNLSETTLAKFTSSYPNIPAYHSYQNPFFKVTVGDFRTKSEAMKLLQMLKAEYPSAFVVKENINYPSVETEL